MNREDIMKLEAGREMDALIAEKVMGLRLLDNEFYRLNGAGAVLRIYKYSKDIAAAWEVVEKFSNFSMGRAWKLDGSSAGYNCLISEGVNAFAKTMPLAICRAALLAVMEAE